MASWSSPLQQTFRQRRSTWPTPPRKKRTHAEGSTRRASMPEMPRADEARSNDPRLGALPELFGFWCESAAARQRRSSTVCWLAARGRSPTRPSEPLLTCAARKV
jgi:hypothetical protein